MSEIRAILFDFGNTLVKVVYHYDIQLSNLYTFFIKEGFAFPSFWDFKETYSKTRDEQRLISQKTLKEIDLNKRFCNVLKKFGYSCHPENDIIIKAVDLYIGVFFRKCLDYAHKFYSSDWCILSAKYGFLLPDDIVPGPYNVSFNDSKTNPITLQKLSDQIRKGRLDYYRQIVILGGKKYVEIIKSLFSDRRIISPLRGCKGIGYMMAKLNDSIRSDMPL